MDSPKMSEACLNNLSEALSEALELKKCSICLEEVVGAILYWPCTHCFCKTCTLSHQKGNQAAKSRCPLCNALTSRRSIVQFEEVHLQYKECLDQLIGSLSLDIGFDITSYKTKKNELLNKESNSIDGKTDHQTRVQNLTHSRLQGRKTATNRSMRSNKRSAKTDSAPKYQKVFPSEDRKLQNELTMDDSANDTLPNSRKEKVHSWILSSKFSQADRVDEAHTVAAQVHRESSQNEQIPLSEDTQLLSVTQSDPKRFPSKQKSKSKVDNTQSDIEAIKPYDESSHSKIVEISMDNKTVLTSLDEKFDRLLGTKGRCHRITTTYGSKIPTTRLAARPKSFPFEEGLFQSIQEISNGKLSSSSENQSISNSQETITKDFSSGSGEEWIPESLKNEKQPKVNHLTKNEKKTRSSTINQTKEELYIDDGLNLKQTTKNTDKDNIEVLKENNVVRNDSTLEVKRSEVSSDSLAKKKPEDFEALREVNENCDKPSNKDIHKNIYKKGAGDDIGTNTSIKRSPGWSKLSTTRKEFHMSEKKKLNLKTISKAKPTLSLSKLTKDIVQGLNTNIVEISSDSSKTPTKIVMNSGRNEKIENEANSTGFYQSPGMKPSPLVQRRKSLSPEQLNNCNNEVQLQQGECQLNISSTTSNGSPFKGFTSPNECNKDGIGKMVGTSNQSSIYEKCCAPLNDINPECNKILSANPVIGIIEEQIPMKSSSGVKILDISPLHKSTEIHNKKDYQSSAIINTSSKRDRDEEIDTHDDSAFYSPVQKKRCVDVQIQTSPGRVHSLVKDFIKEMFKSKENTPLKELLNEEDLKLSNAKPTSFSAERVQNKESFDWSNHGLQSPEKGDIVDENNGLSPEKSIIDSDIVLGTERSTTGGKFRSNWLSTVRKVKDLERTVFICGDVDEVDDDAITQPYKTPVCPRDASAPLTDLQSTVVSNPTQSELKKAAADFDKTHCLKFPESTFKETPLNESGIGRLHGLSTELNTNKDMPKHSPKLKDKCNKSRRQLEFDECSKSRDDSSFVQSPERTEVLINSINKDCDPSNVHSDEKDIEGKSPRQQLLSTTEVNVNPISISQSTPKNSKDIFHSFQMPMSINKQREQSEAEIDINWNCAHHSYSQEIEERKDFQANGSEILIKKDENKSLREGEAVGFCSDDEEVINSTNEDFFIQATPDDTRPDLKNNVESVEKQTKQIECEVLHENAKDELVKEQEVRDNCVQVEETKNEENTEPAKEPDSLCFASSLLKPEQNKILHNVLHGLGIPFSSTIGNHISHLIVGTIDGCFQNTYKVLYAMAMHKPIISYDWVVQVVKTGGTVPLDPYIALDPKGECSVLRARKDDKRLLLKGFAIHVYNVMDNLIKKEQAEELIQLCGGTIVSQMNNFLAVPRSMLRIIILSEPPDASTQGDWQSKYSAAAVIMDWLYSTIGQYKVTPLLPFMLNPNEAVQFLRQGCYPESLLFG